MTDAPTTRETADHSSEVRNMVADHAELALLANAALEIYSDDVLVVGGTRRIHADNIILAVKNGVDRLIANEAALLSEIAALRDYGRDVAKEAVEYRRQRDELRKALERIADEAPYRSGYCQSDVEYGPALSADEMQAVARQALANQGADQ